MISLQRKFRRFRISRQNFFVLILCIVSLYIYSNLLLQAKLGRSSRESAIFKKLERCYANIYGTIIDEPFQLLNFIPKEGVPIESIEKRLLQDENLNIKLGGKYEPLSCRSVFKIAIIVPNKQKNLESIQIFLDFFHTYLIDQNVEYGIFFVEPYDENLIFNRGLLMNIGYVEVLKQDPDYNCFFFHDIDMIPQDKRIIYECNHQLPKHFAVAVSKYNYNITGPFKHFFGGVTAFTGEQFELINGFSNIIFDWSRDDVDLFFRAKYIFGNVLKLNPQIGRYYAPPEQEQIFSEKSGEILKAIHEEIKKTGIIEGLDTLVYRRVSVEKARLFTRFYVTYDEMTIVDRHLDNRNKLTKLQDSEP